MLYHTVMEQIASHGFVVMSPFVISYPTIEYNTAWQIELHGWAERHVEDVLINEYGELMRSKDLKLDSYCTDA